MTEWPTYQFPDVKPVTTASNVVHRDSSEAEGGQFSLFPPHDFHTIPPRESNELGNEFYSIPIADIPTLAAEYIKWLELAETTEACTCEWIIHPDDLEIRADHCRNCNHRRKDHDKNYPHHDTDHHEDCPCMIYLPRRLRKGEASLDCPVHTREGLVIGFFQWVFREHVQNESQESQGVETGN